MRTVQLCTQREREGRELIDSASWDKDGAPGKLEAPSRPRPQGRALKAALSRSRRSSPPLPHGAAMSGSGWRSAPWRSNRTAQGPMGGRSTGTGHPPQPVVDSEARKHLGHHTRGYYEAEDLPRLAGPSDATTRLQPDFDEATGQVYSLATHLCLVSKFARRGLGASLLLLVLQRRLTTLLAH